MYNKVISKNCVWKLHSAQPPLAPASSACRELGSTRLYEMVVGDATDTFGLLKLHYEAITQCAQLVVLDRSLLVAVQ